MKNPVIAIGLDAANSALIETWMNQGYLKNLSRLREQGAFTPLRDSDYTKAKTPYYRAETPWTSFLTGCSPQTTGFWGQIKFYEGTYTAFEEEECKGGAYDFTEYPPFYAQKGRRSVVFDVPQSKIVDGVDGCQILAWGAHAPMARSQSSPEALLQDLIDKHGKHPLLYRDHAETTNLESLKRLAEGLKQGITRRVAICQDLLQREQWDLFLTVFGEIHAAEHFMWHVSQPDHPFHSLTDHSEDYLRDIFQAVDQAIGAILEAAPDPAHIVIFAVHSMATNTTDLPAMVFLPEWLYRFSFPGKMALASGRASSQPGQPIVRSRKRGWTGETWSLRHDPQPVRGFLRRNLPMRVYKRLEKVLGIPQDGLASPDELKAEGNTLYWQPTSWYSRLWPEMKAFALPSYSEGFIRINLAGREPAGIVSPEDYESVCDQICEGLEQLKDARTGQPMVREIIRTRRSALDRDPKLPAADLIVLWQDDRPTDVVDSPEYGRIGPVPHGRTGGHRAGGFLLVKSPKIPAGFQLPVGQLLDIPPTILSLMDAPVPQHLEGESLLPVLATAGIESRCP